MTVQRMVICNIVKQSQKHLTASEIRELAKAELGKVALATVYNNLNSLVEEGIIGRVTADGKTELFDKLPSPHAHLLCTKCGKLTDVPVGGLKSYFAEKTEEEIEDFTLIMKYTCKECKEKDK